MSIADSPSADNALLLRARLLLLAVIAGVSVANIYYNQPLLDDLRRAFPASASRLIGAVPAATQLGYAIGILLLVSLGDRFDRRRLILLQLAGLCVALFGAAGASTMPMLIASSLAVGILSTIPQQAVPFAVELAPLSQRGHAVGTVMSGLLIGILLARTASGFIGEHFGWRAVFYISIVAQLVLMIVVVLRLPHSTPSSTLGYGKLMASLWHLTVELRGLRDATATGALLFGAFNAFWAVLALLLARAPFHLGPQAAGLFGIVGVAGALAAPYAGRSADKRGPRMVISLAIGLVALSFVIFAVSSTSLVGLSIGVIVLDIGVQAALISNQARIYSLRPEARSRVNTVYMTGYFIGGALGSSGGVSAWRAFGWQGVCVVGLIFAALAGGVHARSKFAEA